MISRQSKGHQIIHSILSQQRKSPYSFDVRGSVHHSKIHKEKSNKMQQRVKILLFHQLHIQQPSTYEKPEAASAVLGS
jgi:hypothetical protein